MIDDFEVKFRDIFSTPVYHIVSNKQDTSSIKKMCQWALEIEKEDKGIVVSNKINGYHSTPSANYNTIPYIDLLQSKLNFLPQFGFINWWISIQHQGDYNVSHNHPDSDLSFIWYLTDNHNSLVFTNPVYEMSRSRLYVAFDKYPNNPFNLNYTWDCKAGDILVFPSDLVHYTNVHKKKEPRVCLSGNISMILDV